MPQNMFLRRIRFILGAVAPAIVLAAMLVVMVFAGSPDAHAGQYATSKSPFWKVGDINKVLSSLCRKRQFNQIRHFTLHIGYLGKVGQGITGIAKKGWNLYDPTNIGIRGLTYHFFNDGVSNCKVYTAGKPERGR